MGSVTDWLTALREGDRTAAQLIWNRYYGQLVRFARAQMREVSNPLSDEEDIALIAFDNFFRAIEANRYPDVYDRQNLWYLLLCIAARKSKSAVRFEASQRRNQARNERIDNFDDLAGDEMSPESVCATTESLRELLDELSDRQLKQIAILRMEGHTPGEIAARFGCSGSTIQRKLRRIRESWSHHIGL